MTASSRGSKAAVGLIRSSRSPRVCSECVSVSLRSRQYATASAEAIKPSSSSLPIPNASAIPPVTTSPAGQFVVNSGILLSRPPIITKPISSFEKAYYLYQKRLNERLAMPFTRYFYHKKDTPADIDWKRKSAQRNGVAARELGGYQAYSSLGWNDEVLAGDKMGDFKTIVEKLRDDARTVDEETGALIEGVEELQKRYTDADDNRDVRRLDRKLARTLYLCVEKSGNWIFPAGPLVGRENLHQAAERILVQSAGPNMNTWIVGRVPAGHHIRKPREGESRAIEKTFFLRGRIMAGQANLEGNQFGLNDYKWLTKQELAKVLKPKYFSQVQNMMSDR